MDFFLLLLANASLFIRPAEVAPQLEVVPIYLLAIGACLAAAAPKLFHLWATVPLRDRPDTVCLLGVLGCVVASHLVHGDMYMVRAAGIEFAKLTLYFLLLVTVLDTAARLHTFLAWLVIIIALTATIALLHHHEYIHLPAIVPVLREEEDPVTKEVVTILQLSGTGIFSDPNDLSLVLVTGLLLSLYFAGDRRSGPFRAAWLAPLGLFGYAIMRTQSRGGLLALIAGLGTLAANRIGLRRTVIVGVLVLPVALGVLGGRFAKISTQEGTAQERMSKWRDSLALFRQQPLFGIGSGKLDGEIGLVAHNSYVQAFAETGAPGAFFFLGAFVFSSRMLLKGVGGEGRTPVDPETARLRPYLLAILVGLAVGLFTLSRNYTASTYLPIALAEVYHRLTATEGDRVRFDSTSSLGVLGAEAATLAFLYVFLNVT